MSTKMTGAEKLNLVLQHQRLLRAKPDYETVEELCREHGVSRENLRQWHQQLVERAEEIYADRRFFHERRALEEENSKLKQQNLALKKRLAIYLDDTVEDDGDELE